MPPYRRTRHSELTPVQPKESAYKSSTDGRTKQPHHHQQYHHYQHFARPPKRAFSMTRLDQLARPRQRYLEEALKLRASKTKENLCSAASVRPTSSMSLAPKQIAKPADHSTLNHVSPHQSTNNGTLLLRQRTSARKQRPVSYAGYSIGSSNQPPSDSNLDQRSLVSNGRQSVKAKLPFVGVPSRNLSSANSSNSARHSLMVSSIDGSMASSLVNSGSKPTPPRKPAHIKAASAARKLAKQQDITESDRMRKSESSPRISQQLGNHQASHHAKRSSSKDRMKKSVTNPEKIADLLSEHSVQPSDGRRVVISLNKSNDRLEASDLLGDDRPSEPATASVDLLVEEDRSSNPVCQLIDLNNDEDVSSEAAERRRQAEEEQERKQREEEERKQRDEERKQREEEEERRRKAEEEEEQRRQENEEMRRRAADEEKKRLAREEKERELERRAKEKAEKARLEMEERLKKDEQERIERKRVSFW